MPKEANRCPKCGGTSYWFRRDGSEPYWSGLRFQAMPSRKCFQCGYVWEPLAPKWVLIFGLFFGLALSSWSFFWLFVGTYQTTSGIAFLVIGISVTLGSFKQLIWPRKR